MTSSSSFHIDLPLVLASQKMHKVRVKNAKFEKEAATPHTAAEKEAMKKKGNGLSAGPVLIGFFVLVLVGSALIQLVRAVTSGQPY
ncbi:hypothetical protein PAPYR_1348 [Paratrimastix pyriformis]|uniref:Stress-associated endoplasmic reticulum protein n=1 Tax=Paratrimastix pyriformis TaxID=342808 RepID=A0ABQ8UVM4_9EUKA|nr:hypothetical protein PAPYR_1348 [Paratrimastix pyriformis]